ncbi:MAG: hypothetical protein ACK4RF_03810, partial [Cyclobacteriaceae bacterium]
MKFFRHWNAALRNSLALAGCGLIGIASVTLAGRFIRLGYEESMMYQNLVSGCKLGIANSQLHYHRVAAGDHSVDFAEEVIAPLNNAQGRLETAYAGGYAGKDYFPKPDEDMQVLLKTVLYDVQEALNLIRYQKQTGTFAKATADDAFEKASRSLDKLSAHLETRAMTHRQNVQRTSAITLFGLISAGVLGVVWYFRFYRSREKSIHSANKKLSEETRRVETLSRFIEAIANADYSIAL